MSTLDVDSGCGLCRRLHIGADPNAHRLGGIHIERSGSALVLDGRRVSILRSEPGK
jgi:hypothetical protein